MDNEVACNNVKRTSPRTNKPRDEPVLGRTSPEPNLLTWRESRSVHTTDTALKYLVKQSTLNNK